VPRSTRRALALYESIPDWPQVARLAEALEKQGQFARAAEVYEQANRLDKALTLAESLKDWERAARLAGQLNLWERQARAYREQGLITQAGDAYERAAMQLSADAPEAELARLYDAAAQCYGEEDTEVRCYEACLDRVCRYRHLSNLRGRFDLKRPFI
jgi:tetratricopeptide (TPR) repeat protein